MKHIKTIHYITLTLTILWMAAIFIFSSQTGEVSSNTSGTIVNFLISIFVPDFDNYNALKQQNTIDTISFIIRKGAHFTEYGILGFLCFFTTLSYIWKKSESANKQRYLELFRSKRIKYGALSLAISCLYAISDEFHQGFVADRSPAIFDVIIDTAGGLAGIIVACCFIFLILRKENKVKQVPHS